LLSSNNSFFSWISLWLVIWSLNSEIECRLILYNLARSQIIRRKLTTAGYTWNYHNFVFRAPDWLIVVTWFNHKKLTDSLFPEIEPYKPHYTKNRKLTDLGACLRCVNYDVTMHCDAKHDVTMRCLHQLIVCISRSHWYIKEMANSLFS
jgi:hypothetical protein